MSTSRIMFTALRQPVRNSLTSIVRRNLTSSSILRTSAGYGDPQDEKIANQTPQPNADPKEQTFPSSQPDPHPHGKGKSTGTTSGLTDPEVAGKSGGKADKEVTEKEIIETKKIGQQPKKEEVGGAGVIGG